VASTTGDEDWQVNLQMDFRWRTRCDASFLRGSKWKLPRSSRDETESAQYF
jgi:hypothetical protein